MQKQTNINKRLKDRFKYLPNKLHPLNMSYLMTTKKSKEQGVLLEHKDLDVRIKFLFHINDEHGVEKPIKEQYMTVEYSDAERTLLSEDFYLEKSKELFNSFSFFVGDKLYPIERARFIYDSTTTIPYFLKIFFNEEVNDSDSEKFDSLFSEGFSNLEKSQSEYQNAKAKLTESKSSFDDEFEKVTKAEEIERIEADILKLKLRLTEVKNQEEKQIRKLKTKYNINNNENVKKARENKIFRDVSENWNLAVKIIRENKLKVSPERILNNITSKYQKR